MYLLALLQAAGITAQPVILSTRNHGKIKIDYPFTHFFNYVIVLVDNDGQLLLTDATENSIPYNRLPTRCINEKGLIVSKDSAKWISLNTSVHSLNLKSIVLSVEPDATKGKVFVTINSTEFEAYRYRSKYKDDTLKAKKSLRNNGLSKIDKINIMNYENPDKPYIISISGSTDYEKIENRIIINPFLKFPLQENKLTQKKRSYPVDFVYPKNEIIASRINVPKNYKVIAIPDNFSLDNTLAQIKLTYKINGDVIEAEAIFKLKKAVYKPSEYAKIKFYMNTVVKKFNQQIVIEEI